MPSIQKKIVSVDKRLLIDRFVREIIVLFLVPLVIYLLVCFWSYQPSDPGWSHAGRTQGISNWGGTLGAWIADLTLYFMGVSAYWLVLLGMYVIWKLMSGQVDRSPFAPSLRLIGFILLLTTSAALAQLHLLSVVSYLPAQAGGVAGQMIVKLLSGLGDLGATLFLGALFFTALTLTMNISWFQVLDQVGKTSIKLYQFLAKLIQLTFTKWQDHRVRSKREHARALDQQKRSQREPLKIQPKIEILEKSDRVAREVQLPLFQALPDTAMPPLSLLDEPKQAVKSYSHEALEALSRQVELKLKDFRVDVQVVGVYPGPVVTRFELLPAPGVRGSQISGLCKDIARGLSVVSVRVVDVIPGKTVVGLEIPNSQREMVTLSEMMRSKEYDKMHSPLTLALGKDIGGRPFVVDLAKMPHLLVAGTTGSGKSVALNAMVLSLLYKATPKQVRMLMIDPKMLELSVYQDIPHLITPVITDMKDAANALRWCVAEMERRYKLMAAIGVRQLAGFNRKVEEAQAAGQPLLDPLFMPSEDYPDLLPKPLEVLPFLVIVIDELADMMMIVGKKVEELIARLAQKARAAGIHLVLATQRPSVDVITGLIKANIPSRIAFQVSSKIDSRTILDQSGAEQLLGHGDMLYLPPGTAMPERVHGAFVSDEEVHRVVQYLKQHYEKPEYAEGVVDDVQMLGDGSIVGPTGLPEMDHLGGGNSDIDVLYDQAVRMVTETRRASISGVQRRLKIGYNRAARLIEEMESAGIVSSPENNGNRTVLAPPPPSVD